MSDETNPKQDWMQTKWRPMMAVTYMAINICDFILFPVLFSILQFWESSVANDAFRQWEPMTLQGGGFIHMAFGAILGISAWTRGQEKVKQLEVESTASSSTAYEEPAPSRNKYAVDE